MKVGLIADHVENRIEQMLGEQGMTPCRQLTLPPIFPRRAFRQIQR